MQHKTSIRFYSSAEPWPRVAGVPGLALSLSSFQRGDGEGNGLKLYLRLEVEGSVIFSLLVILGSGSLPASSSVCSFTSHYRGEFPFWSSSSWCFFERNSSYAIASVVCPLCCFLTLHRDF